MKKDVVSYANVSSIGASPTDGCKEILSAML